MKTQKLIAGALLLTMLTGCGVRTAPAAAETQAESTPAVQTEAPTEAQTAVPRNENTLWIPEGSQLRLARTEHDPDLAALIAETYGIPEESWESTRYYYDYVDLNDDGVEEILAVVMGMYTSGSGGDSALIIHPAAGMTVSQQFTLVRAPILISDQMTNGAHDLIFLRSGGGSEPAFVRLTGTDGIYTNPADAEVLSSLDGITGTAILCNDIAADLNSGNALTLAGGK